MGCMEMSHSALAIYYKAVQATPQIPLQFWYNEVKLGNLSRNIKMVYSRFKIKCL